MVKEKQEEHEYKYDQDNNLNKYFVSYHHNDNVDMDDSMVDVVDVVGIVFDDDDDDDDVCLINFQET